MFKYNDGQSVGEGIYVYDMQLKGIPFEFRVLMNRWDSGEYTVTIWKWSLYTGFEHAPLPLFGLHSTSFPNRTSAKRAVIHAVRRHYSWLKVDSSWVTFD